jgi:hypothetical protein
MEPVNFFNQVNKVYIKLSKTFSIKLTCEITLTTWNFVEPENTEERFFLYSITNYFELKGTVSMICLFNHSMSAVR